MNIFNNWRKKKKATATPTLNGEVAPQPFKYLTQTGENEYTFVDQFKNKVLFHIIWKDKAGNSYFQFNDIKQMAAMRNIAGKTAVIEAEWGVTLKQAVAYLDKALQCLNVPNVGEASHNLHLLRERVLRTNPEQAYLNLATVYSLIEGENPEIFEGEFQKKKLLLWEQDPKSKVFFLNHAYADTTNLITISNTDTLLFLMKQMGELLTNSNEALKEKSIKS